MVKKTLKRLFGRDFYNFIKHAKNYISAEFFAKGVVFLSLPIFTRLLVPKEFGYISIFTSIVQIFTIIASLGVNGTVTRFYHDKNIKFDEFYGSVTIFILLWSIIISILLVFFSSKLSIFFNIPKGLIYIAIGLIFPSILVKILFSYFIASQKSKKVAIIKIIRSISYIIIAICITLVLDKYKYYGIPISKLFVGIIIFFFSFYIIREKANFTIKKKPLQNWKDFNSQIL